MPIELDVLTEKLREQGKTEEEIQNIVKYYDDYVEREDLLAKQQEQKLLDEEAANRSVIGSMLAKGARGWIDTARGFEEAKNNIIFAATNAFNPDLTTEEKQVLKLSLKAKGLGLPGALPVMAFDKIKQDLNNRIRLTESSTISESIEKGNWAETAELAIGGLLETTPSLVAAATGYGGIALFGMSVAGNKFDEEFEANPEQSIQNLTLNAIGTGALESTFELATRGLMKYTGLIANKSGTDAAKEFLKTGFTNVAKKIGVASIGEGIGETATELSVMGLDAITLGKDIDLFAKETLYRLGDSFILGNLMGGSFGTLGAATSTARNRAEFLLTPIDTKKQMLSVANEISKLTKDLSNTQTEEGKKIISDKINRLENNLVRARAEVSKALNSLNQEELSTYAKNQDEIIKLQQILSSNDPDLTKQTAEEKIKELQDQNYNLFVDGAKRHLAKNIETIKPAAEKLGVEIQEFATKQEFTENTGQDADVDGFIQDNKIFINNERAAEVGAISVGSHELLHRIISSKLTNKNTKEELANGLINILREEGNLDVVQKRIDDSYKFDKNGNERKFDEYAEEYFTVFSDAIVKGDIQYKETVFQKILNFLNSFVNKFTPFKQAKFNTAQQAYDFVKDYSKNIQKGVVTEQAIDLAGQQKAVEKLVRGSEIVANQLGAGIIRFDNTADFLGAIELLKAEGVDIDLKTNEKGEIEPAEKQSYGLIANLPNGDKQIIINNVSSEADGVLPADKHEVLHAFASKMDPNKLYKMGRDLYNSIINDSGDVTSRFEVDNRVKKALIGYLKKYEAGRISKEKFYEEVMAVVSDGLTRGDVKVKKTGPLINILNNFLENIKFKQSFKDGNQAIEFLKDFNRDVMSGKGLSKETLGKAGVKFSKTIGDQIKALVPPGTTKQQYDTQVIGDVYNDLVIGDRLNGLIRSELNRFGVTGDNVYGKPIDQFLDDVKQRLFEGTLSRFNPEINDDLGGLVVDELQRFRIGDVVNTYKRQQAGSLDVQAGETGSIRTPVADEVDIDIKTTETLRSELKQGLKINNEQFVDKSLDTELQTNTLEIIEGVTPEIDGKDLITYLKDASQQKSFKTIKNKLKNLNEFLEDNYKVLFHGKNLPIATLVALERKTPVEERIFTGEPTRLTTQNQIDKAVNEGDFHVENEKQGPSRYPRKKPTIEQVLKFFNPPTKNPKTGKPSGLKGTRKDGIVNAIAFSLFRDYAPETMNRASIDPRDIAKVSQRLIVDPTIKFSLSAGEASKVANLAKLLAAKSRPLSKEYSYPDGKEFKIGTTTTSYLQTYKDTGLKQNPYSSLDPKHTEDKQIYDRNKPLPKHLASFEGETVLEAATRIINNFLLEYPRYYDFLRTALVFGMDRSMFGRKSIWNAKINKPTPDKKKKKKKEDVPTYGGETKAAFKKTNMTVSSKADKKRYGPRTVRFGWIEETKEENYVEKQEVNLDDLMSFIEDFNSYLNKEVNENLVYNASPKSFDKLGERTGLIYLATNKREANAYAESNRGEVKNIYIDNNKIASEQELINTMKEIGVNTSEGLTYELIDSRFDNFYIGKKAMDKVKESLLQKGFKAARYKDGAQVVSGKVESIVVFDKSVISDKKGKINNNKDTWFLDEFGMQSQNSMSSPTRTSAPAFVYEIINGIKNKPFKKAGIEEHFDPQNDIITILIGGTKDGNFNLYKDIIKASYMQGFISDANNDRVNEDFKSTKPDLFYEGVKLLLQGKLELDSGLLSVIRYTESDVNLNNLYYIPTKQTLGEYFFDANNLPLKTQKELIRDLFKGELTLKDLRDYGKIYNSVGKQTVKAFKSNLKQPNVKKYSFSKSASGLFNDLNNHDKALRNARDLNAPKKGISIFDFDDTVATSKSMIIVTMPEEIQKITGTGNAVKVINTVYKGAVDLIAKNKKIESINFTSDAAESSRIKLYNTLANKLKKDLGWSLDLFETTGFGKKESEDFTLTKPKKQKNIKTLGSNLNFIEDTVGNFKSSFEINNRTYNVSLDKKGEGDYDLNFSLIGESKGKTFKLTPQQFAKQHSDLELQGAEFDFSEFNKVIDGKPGPLAAKIKKQIDKFGNKDVYILTARPQVSATSIKAFLDGIGINIPLKNITGLENGSPQAKANWVIGKAADGYNDFYFTDDVYKNVKAVQEALEVLDVKSKTRLAYADRIKKLDKDFNDILEATTGVGSEKEYSKVKAELLRGNKGRYEFFIHASADDFAGLLQRFEGKGVVGDNAKLWFKKNLLDPFATAMGNLSRERVALMSDYDALKKQIGIVPKNLRKKMGEGIFTNEHAVRVYIWNKQGMEVPGLSKRDLKELTKYINNNKKFKVFADQLIAIHKADGYPKADSAWSGGTITLDMQNGLDVSSRAKNLQAWEQNVDIIFSDKNLNKIEALYGQPLREALTGMIKRMKTGKNRSFQSDTLTGKTVDFLNGAVGGVMFFNSRSSVLQTISLVNFINYEDNNIFAASKAFANQKQFWKDFKKLMNSDFLIDRRRGVRFSLNENDIANIAQKHGARGVIARALEIGFLPTQIADSFAIAVGGASFYRNRINTYKKQGLSDQQAEAKAFQNFREIAEETQQSSRPDRVSQQQAGPMGRLLLAFQNVTMQFNRVGKKNFLDLKNGRRVLKFDGTFHSLNKSRQIQLSKMGYYFFVQNLIFNALQKALFALYFGDVDEEDEKFKNKYIEIANSMVDSILRGTGIFGGVISVIKNAAIMHQKQAESPNPKYEKVGLELLKVSPPISSKISKVVSAVTTLGWEKEEIKEKGFSIDNPALLSATKLISAFTNAPLDRVVIKTNNIATALGQQLELWERIALLGGWQDWELGIEDKDKPKGKVKFGQTRQTRKIKRKTRKKELIIK